METFIFHHWWCSIRITSIAVILFSFYLFLNFYVYATIWKYYPTFSILNNSINWNDNKLVFYARLGFCGQRSSAHLPLGMAHLKGLVFTFDGKNQRQWNATCNIKWPSHRHVHTHWTKWKHWNLHDLWEKQDHWKFHPTFTWWFMDLIF